MKTVEEKIRFLGMINYYADLDIRDKEKFKKHLDGLLEHYATKFAHYIDVELSDYAKGLKSIREHYEEWLNNSIS